MALTPREQLASERHRIEDAVDDFLTADEADRILTFADALDDSTVSEKYRDPDSELQTYAPKTIKSYISGIRLTAREGVDLTDTTAADLNEQMNRFHDDDGLSKSTLGIRQSALKAFYNHHDDLGVDPDDIVRFKPDKSSSVDETDMFTADEVEALRRAVGETQLPLRNRAFLELCIFTGQRKLALLTLRIRDVDVENGYIYLNDEFEAENAGLKGALERGRKRPMFGATKYVRDWLNHHPHRDDDDAWLFIPDPSNAQSSTDDYWSEPAVERLFSRVADTAGIDDKPVKPHNFRHFCATVLYRDYDVDTDTIRMLLGHSDTSRTLEETYSHVFDEDHVRKAEEAMGFRDADEEDRKALTPETCPTCGTLIEPDWRSCPNCNAVFGPAAEVEDAEEDISEELTDAALDQNLSEEERDGLRALLSALDDPEAVAEKLNQL
ncbi:hypothetical protein B9H04_12025 [Halorubrum ezzemoulense DSM 17463]|uniref:Integrase n=1 Tax=Halorubrum ezzemoulense DSM 17463 TaxID=1121945 RepID=A0A1X4GKC4_HALEZ|nr:tyrosine-type recombinase/integrase [Halorubrum ezzemoulense]OSO97643.1 hypothetical protein B9H04_12025 [Halorubrum ezzemoulense DSM 17463]